MQTAPETVILAEDEASLYLQATIKGVWAPIGQTPIVYSDPGRGKVNFYGALNLRHGNEVVMQAQQMNNETSAIFLKQILVAYPEKPILLIWDRAPWHFGKAIRDLQAAHPRLEILYFPPGSPDLNPQELVWKMARQQISHNHLKTRLSKLADDFQFYLEEQLFSSAFLARFVPPHLCGTFT